MPQGKVLFLAVELTYCPFDILRNPSIHAWPLHSEDTMHRFDDLQSLESEVGRGEFIIQDGYYAIDSNTLYESNKTVWMPDRSHRRIDPRPLSFLKTIKPHAIIGTTIYVFTADQIRHSYHDSGI